MAAKSYLRYKQEKLLGLVASPSSNIVCDKAGFLVLSPGLEDVLVWNMRSGTLVRRSALFDAEVDAAATTPPPCTLFPHRLVGWRAQQTPKCLH